jgi:hypothetical protein
MALAHCTAIMLAQFSMAPAADRVRRRLPLPILTSPAAAVGSLQRRLARNSSIEA